MPKFPHKSKSEEKEFNDVLKSAKRALDSVNVKFHLTYGTALGAHRERSFIAHDHDMDLAVFYKDVNTPEKIRKLKMAMEDEGFEINSILGKPSRGYEIQFVKDDIPLDIMWVYEGEYRDKHYYLISTYYGICDELKHKTCIWGYRPYKLQKIKFLGTEYNIIPTSTLEDMYGKDWKIPRQYGYHEGLEQGHFKGLIKDYFDPRPTDTKIAFCFLLYSTVDHVKIWEQFFSQDNYPVKSYNIYSHIKEVKENTPKWLSDNKIRTIKTGWCEESLVWAWCNMLKAALKDETNKYFCLLSGSCIPLLTYNETYKEICSTSKSRINIDFEHAARDKGLYYADQWVILNRKHAQVLINLRETIEGEKYLKKLRKIICDKKECLCPDEIYPISWFVHKYGNPSSSTFKREFIDRQTTYTYWDDSGQPHPIKFNNVRLQKFKNKICKSGSIFARKFNNKAANNIAMKCD